MIGLRGVPAADAEYIDFFSEFAILLQNCDACSVALSL
jgi:hypothetical protein